MNKEEKIRKKKERKKKLIIDMYVKTL